MSSGSALSLFSYSVSKPIRNIASLAAGRLSFVLITRRSRARLDFRGSGFGLDVSGEFAMIADSCLQFPLDATPPCGRFFTAQRDHKPYRSARNQISQASPACSLSVGVIWPSGNGKSSPNVSRDASARRRIADGVRGLLCGGCNATAKPSPFGP